MLDPLLPMVPTARYYDSERSLWIVSRYSEVVDTFRADGPSAPGHDEFRQSGFARFSGYLIPEEALRQCADVLLKAGPVELVSEFARPWSFGAAVRILGLDERLARELGPLASAVFAAAAEPFNAELQRQASDATVELGSVVGAPDVQAFVALTETLPAFIVNAYFVLLQCGASIERVTPAAVEELLRYAGPAVAQLRTGVAGERIALMIASANRDPEQFPEPNDLRLDRRRNHHLALGFGTHSCIGAAIIRALSRIALNALLERFKRPVLLDCAPRCAFAIRSLASLHIKSQP